ncbi:unnamed protein product [Effrenium voratum]|nr:unnamed protein product [Effrenium voratum]
MLFMLSLVRFSDKAGMQFEAWGWPCEVLLKLGHRPSVTFFSQRMSGMAWSQVFISCSTSKMASPTSASPSEINVANSGKLLIVRILARGMPFVLVRLLSDRVSTQLQDWGWPCEVLLKLGRRPRVIRSFLRGRAEVSGALAHAWPGFKFSEVFSRQTWRAM